MFDVRSTYFYDAGGFVAEDDGGFDNIAADATMLPVVDLIVTMSVSINAENGE